MYELACSLTAWVSPLILQKSFEILPLSFTVSLVFYFLRSSYSPPSLSLSLAISPLNLPPPSLSRNSSGSYHLPAVKTQQVSVGVVNEFDFVLDIHYQWMDDPVKPTHIRA